MSRRRERFARAAAVSLLALASLLAAMTPAHAQALLPEVSIAGTARQTEGADLMFTLTLSPAPSSELMVDVMVSESGSVLPSGGSTTQVTVAANANTATLTVATDDDNVHEGTGTPRIAGRVTATVDAGTGYTVHATANSASIDVQDNEVLSWSADVDSTTIAEAGGTSVLTVETGGPEFAAPRTINLVRRTATPPTTPDDYTVASGGSTIALSGVVYSLTLAAGQTSLTATITAVDDENVEPNERFDFFFAGISGLGLFRITITDDESTNLGLTVMPDTVAEGDGATELTVIGMLNGKSRAEDTEVTLTVSPGTAAAADYTVGTAILTIAGGVTSGTATLTLTPEDDTDHEPSETVTVGGTVPVAGLTVGTAALTITDNDDPEIVSVSLRAKSQDPSLPYAIGEAILVDVTFNGPMTVTGEPAIELDVGGSPKSAPLFEHSGSVLTFRYVVEVGVEDTDGVSIAADKLSLNGGTISTAATSVSLAADNLTHAMVADSAGHEVDGVRPTVTAASVNGSTLTLTWSEALNDSPTPPGSAFALTLGSGETAPSVSTVAVDGNTMTLTLSAPVAASVTATLDYTPGTPPIEDLPGNDAEAIDGQEVTNEVQNVAPVFPPETVTTREVPENTAVGTVIGAALTATDTDNDDLTYTLGGPDEGFFQLNSSTELVLTTVLDFETPGSADGDNGYEVTVTANDGTVDAVISVTVNVTDVPDVMPGKPANLAAAPDGPNTVNLSWAAPAPAATATSRATRSRNRATAITGRNWTASTGSDGTTYEHTGRTPDTTYHYRVSAINTAGAGPASDPASTTTPLHEVSVMAVAASVTEGRPRRWSSR